MDGFRINRVDASVLLDSSLIGFLYADEVYLNATTTRTIAGAASRTVKVLATGSTYMNGGAVVTTANSGPDLLVTITVARDGFYRIFLSGGKLSSFGVQWESSTGLLSVSSDNASLAFVGNAVFQNTQKSDAYTQLSSGGLGGFVAGVKDPFFNYRISSCPNPPTCFIQMGTPGYFLVTGIVRIDATTWEITVAGDNWGATPGTQYPIIKCFARMSGAGTSGYGIKLFDASGNRTWDSNEKMLVPGQAIDWVAYNDSANASYSQTATPTVSNPYLLSLAESDYSGSFATTTAVGGYYTMTEYIQGYQIISGSLTRKSWAIVADKYKDDRRAFGNSLPVDRTYLIDGSLYT